MENKINIERELKQISKDLDNMERAGLKQIVFSFFSGFENEREFILAARAAIKARGYEAVHEYDGDELLLIVRKAA